MPACSRCASWPKADPTVGSQIGSLVFGHVELRLAERRVLVGGQPVALGSRGFDLLRALVAKRDRVVSKDELLDEVWPGLVVEENNLQVQISGLRRVLGTQAISTVAGQGYRFTLAAGVGAGVSGGFSGGAGLGETPMPPPIPSPVRSGPLGKVLVADDNKVNRLLLCRSLELMGHRVSSAENGRQALALMREQRFDLLMLDLAMPELDGFGLLELRATDAQLREVSVIVTSALGGVAPVARCIELGAEDFLHKPVDPWLLKARVESSLARKLQRDSQGEALRRLMPGAPAQATRLPDACVLVARLQGLDSLATRRTPQEVMELIGDWNTLMLDAIVENGGEVIQFGGEGLLAVFVEPAAVLKAARDMVALSAQFNGEQEPGGAAPGTQSAAIRFGLGLARGTVVVGLATTSRRVAYACIGAPVLRAEQLAAVGARGGHPILVDGGLHACGLASAQAVAVRADDGFAAFALGWA